MMGKYADLFIKYFLNRNSSTVMTRANHFEGYSECHWEMKRNVWSNFSFIHSHSVFFAWMLCEKTRLTWTSHFPPVPQTLPSMSPEKPALCAGCGGKISDRYYLLAVDKQWHLRCLKCCECKLALESELTCFAKDGSIYCKEDYYR